jgi:hypothetical protein
VIEQFGKYSRMAYPGFNCVLCCVGESVAGGLSTRVQQLNVRCETKTLDNVFVDINVAVQYCIVKENMYDGARSRAHACHRRRRAAATLTPLPPSPCRAAATLTPLPPSPSPSPCGAAFYKLTDARSQITAYVFDEVRASVPKIALDDVFTSKEEIALGIKAELTKTMTGFGFAIIQTLITDIEPAAKVKAAVSGGGACMGVGTMHGRGRGPQRCYANPCLWLTRPTARPRR